jgi:hypothetical protein
MSLPLSGFGTPETHAAVVVNSLSLGERLRRAAMAPAAGLAASILVLPIPIVHLALPPVAILGGLALGVRRALQGEIIQSAHGPCPFCGTDQTLGLTGAAFRLPRDLKCRSCLKLFTLDAA